jgi:hypothetical protein
MENSSEFTLSENKIRKVWLILCILIPAFMLAVSFIYGISELFVEFDSTVLLVVVFGVPLFTGVLYMFYHCAYKNPGTVFLLLNMIGISFKLLQSFGQAHLEAGPLGMLISLCWGGAGFYYSYKLRKINKKIQERRLMASSAYINALGVFSTATNLEELNAQFSRLRVADDSGSTVKALAKAYEQQKKMLTLANSS